MTEELYQNFILQALANKDITVYGKGNQTRSFCYIDDLISGILMMMELENFSGPINLGILVKSRYWI